MFVHSVYFWLRNDLTAGEEAQFKAGLDDLAAIDTVRQAYIGKPASTDRSIIDRSYSYALILAFDDQAGHDSYQVHADHDRFREECAPFWTDVKIYDCVT